MNPSKRNWGGKSQLFFSQLDLSAWHFFSWEIMWKISPNFSEVLWSFSPWNKCQVAVGLLWFLCRNSTFPEQDSPDQGRRNTQGDCCNLYTNCIFPSKGFNGKSQRNEQNWAVFCTEQIKLKQEEVEASYWDSSSSCGNLGNLAAVRRNFREESWYGKTWENNKNAIEHSWNLS